MTAPPESRPSGLLRAVQAGLIQQDLSTGLAAAQRSPAHPLRPEAWEPAGGPVVSPAHSIPRRPIFQLARKAGRQLLRLFRPLALPLLHRLEWRVRTAFEKTGFPEQTAQRFRHLEAMLAQSLQHSQALDARFEQLQLAVDTYARQLQHSIDTRSDEAKAGREIASAATAQLQTQQATTAGMLAHLQADMLHLLQRAAVPLNEEDMLVRTSWGWLATPREDERLLMAMIETAGRLEPGSTAVLTALLDPGQTMIDVGAHIGTMTLPAAHAVGPHGRVVAVEPGPRAAGLLARSLHINSLAERVTLHQLAAGSAEGDAMLHVAAVLGENSLIGSAAGSADSIVVPVRRLDDLLGGIPVDVVKIDAEGYELQVWAGMPSILAENPTLAVIVEFGPVHLARAGITIAAWLDALRGLGFTIWEIDEQSAGVRELRPLAELAEVFSMNLLLLRQSTSHYPRLRVL